MYDQPAKNELYYAIRATLRGYRQSDIDAEMIGTYVRIRDMSEKDAATELAAKFAPFDMMGFVTETFVAHGHANAATSRVLTS